MRLADLLFAIRGNWEFLPAKWPVGLQLPGLNIFFLMFAGYAALLFAIYLNTSSEFLSFKFVFAGCIIYV